MPGALPSIAAVYLARGAETDHLDLIERFARSYRRFAPGVAHRLYVIFKGFVDEASRAAAFACFDRLNAGPLSTDDTTFDLGAYASVAAEIPEEFICFLNTNAEIVAHDWLLKLAVNLALPMVGGVAATGSYESLRGSSSRFRAFPNVHLRSNAFMLRRCKALEYLSSIAIRDKHDAFMLESGPAGMTRQMMAGGAMPLVVGRDGRGFGPEWWLDSHTFRRGSQANLLVHDNVTRHYDDASFAVKTHLTRLSWGDLHSPAMLLPVV